MGILSSKKKTYVNTSVNRLIEDEDIKSTKQIALIDYTINASKRVDVFADSFADLLIQHNRNSIGLRTVKDTNWAKKHYAYGLPTGGLVSNVGIDYAAEVRATISAKIEPVSGMVYATFGPLNNHHFAVAKLIQSYGFNVASNEAITETAKNGFPTYVKDIQIAYRPETLRDAVDPDTLLPIGYAGTSGKTAFRAGNRRAKHTPWKEDASIASDTAYVTFSYKNAQGIEVTYLTQITFLEYEYSGADPVGEMGAEGNIREDYYIEDTNKEQDYFMAMYADANGTLKTFTYEYASNGYPVLDNLFNNIVKEHKYVPQLYLRMWSTPLDAEHLRETNEYKSSVKLAKRMGANYSGLIETVQDSVGDDLGNVTDIFITNRLPVNTNDPIIASYLFEYFYDIYKNLPNVATGSGYSGLRNELIRGMGKSGATMVIKDTVFSYQVAFKSIWYEDVIGHIGDIGHTTSRYAPYDMQSNFLSRGIFGNSMRNLSVHEIKQQISATTVRVLKVYGLVTTQYVSGGYTTSASKEDEHLLIPLDLEVVNKKYRKDRNMLISKSLHVVFNTVQVVKTKWYQTSIFKVIIAIVGIVISVVTAGAGTAWYIAAMKAIAVAVVTSVAITVISKLMVQWGVDGGVIFAVIAVIAIIAGGYAAAGKTTVAGMNATQLMATANSAFSISNNTMALELKERYKALLEYKAMVEGKLDDIEDLRQELGLDVAKVDIYSLLANSIRSPDIRLGESPVQFYERTLSVNVGIGTTQLVNNFAYLTTRLPTFEMFMNKRGDYSHGFI